MGISIRRGYRETFAITILNVVFANARVWVNPQPGSQFSVETTPGAFGQFLAVSSITDGRGTHTRLTLTFPPAASRLISEGATNRCEIERMPLQEYLGEFVIAGTAGLNGD